MRPWELASKTATLDNLSGGRVTLAVGLGAVDTGFPEFGEETDTRVRAELMDEGLDILTGLWKGQPFNYDGKHYTIRETAFSLPPPPVQQPRIPIWVVAVWPRMKSMRRVLRCDGIVPQFAVDEHHRGSSDLVREMRGWLGDNDARPDLDVVAEGQTSATEASGAVAPWAEAGCTWWMESNWEMPHHSAERMDEVRRRLVAGPPTLA